VLCTPTFESECWGSDNHGTRLREAAYARNKLNPLARWWCDKYRLPPNDPRLTSLTPEELAIQFYQDLVEQDVSNVLPPDTDHGKVRVRSADPIADKWDKQLVETGEIDITQDLDEEDAAAFEAFAARMAAKQAPMQMPALPADMNDDTPM